LFFNRAYIVSHKNYQTNLRTFVDSSINQVDKLKLTDD
jgi:hypothetical protein